MADIDFAAAQALLERCGLSLEHVHDGDGIPGSFWGAPEAGIAGACVYVRNDTPVHSFLHETSHLICMTENTRAAFSTNAGSDELEEAAVCYLQVLLADELPGVGRGRLMSDMDDWGYSFRLGSTRRWFGDDADDARQWLYQHDLIDRRDWPAFRLRKH